MGRHASRERVRGASDAYYMYMQKREWHVCVSCGEVQSRGQVVEAVEVEEAVERRE